MLSNVVDLEMEAMRLSLTAPAAAVVLFDFRAAFPSMSQQFLLRILGALGLPDFVLHFISSLYDDNRCSINVSGKAFAGFAMRAGIRQGCPLSPLLFAIVMDILLRRLARLVPTATIRAFADDTASRVLCLCIVVRLTYCLGCADSIQGLSKCRRSGLGRFSFHVH